MTDIELKKIHTTPMGAERIRRNLGLRDEDVARWCVETIKTADKTHREQGHKNWYIHKGDVVLTVNAGNFCIITAHKVKESK